ncbi:oxppcycle protein OpcA [Corynebacterium sp. sy017]|uniref:glucose-6-phosphate dehydrogenase assembly protein OpcA n=1 Tax=unclassified Corynebacterium TaxID=2624378 RepID=UPI0011871EAC|nr:glucose-6-phosphate dehydrogenase assembly protein OpcA [Corynebacterium sp. SY003]MBP3087660.1 oxppcycle protein OpcA [Corynebacterium sp. sy017]TSD92222.1 oxppcycle protein OpcA [Corynebacterium sp. SY003]
MIFDLPDTSTREIAKTLVRKQNTGGQIATGRVLSLIIIAHDADDIDTIIDAAYSASREHPSRVIVLVQSNNQQAQSRLDAQVRIGGDAGASEIIIMQLAGQVSQHLVHVVTPLLLPDTPIVAWWPYHAPTNVAADPIGKIAWRRITDAFHDSHENLLALRSENYMPGDSDMSWARLSPWRRVLASVLDQPPHERVNAVRVYGLKNSPSLDLITAWLSARLEVPVRLVHEDKHINSEESFDTTIRRIELDRDSGTLSVELLEENDTLSVSFPKRKPALVAFPARTIADCLAEELRHLDPDTAYQHALNALEHIHEQSNN